MLDFTSLRAEAAEKIKEEVQKVIRTRGKKNLYVLVNKVDQRGEGDITPEQVRQFVANNLKLIDSNDMDRVFEISAKQAFYSTNFQHELNQYPDVKASDMKTAPAFAQTAFGPLLWKNSLERYKKEQLEMYAEMLWEQSGFALFLEQAVNTIMEQVAPRCIEFALNLCVVRLDDLYNSVQFRKSYIASDAQKLKKAINELYNEISNLEACRRKLDGEVAKTKKQIEVIVQKNLKKLRKNVREQLNKLLIVYAVDSFKALVSNFFKNIHNKDTGEFEFESKDDANKFASKLAESTKQIIKTELNNLCEDTATQTEKLIKELANLLESQTKPIVERAQSRLKKDFQVSFNTDSLRIVDVYIKINNPDTEPNHNFFDSFNVVLESLFDNLFIAIATGVLGLVLNNPLGKAIVSGVAAVAGWLGFKLDKIVMKERYTIKLIPYVEEVVNLFEKKVEAIEQEAKKFIEEYFEKEVERYFKALDSYLNEYKKDLEQSLKDKELPIKKLEELKQALDSFADGSDRLEIDNLREQANTFLRGTNQLLPQRSIVEYS